MFLPPIKLHPLLFVPDMDENTPGCIVDANGMFPTASGARVLPSLVVASAALPSPALAAFLSTLPSGGINIFAGTGQHLYRLLNGVASNPGSGYTYDQFTARALYGTYGNLPRLTYGDIFFQPPAPTFTPGPTWVEVDNGQSYSGLPWSFAQNGSDCIATNGGDPVQVFAGGGTGFAPLAGNPPVAKFVMTVDPGAGASVVTFLANLASDATGWVASGPGSDTVWTLNVADLSASGFLRSQPGPITGAKSLRTYAVLFKDAAFYLGTFVGPPFVWNFQPVSHQVGCASNDAIIDIGDILAFPGPDDFYTFDGQSLTPIPNALREWFFGERDNTGLSQGRTGIADPTYLNKMVARYDVAQGVVYWHFSSINANPAGTLDMYICWNKKSGRWLPGYNIISTVVQTQFGQSGLTYDQFTNRYMQYNLLPKLTYGDISFQPQKIRAQAIILPDNKLYTYTGPANSGYIQTGDIGDAIHLTRINRVRGQFGVFPERAANGFRALMSTFVRRNLGDGLTAFKTNVPLSDQGYFDFRQAAGWHELNIAFQSDAELQALSIDAEDAGDR